MAIERLTAQDEVYDFLLSQPTPEQIIAFRPSEATQARIRYLLDENKKHILSADEQAELDEFSHLEHTMRMLKAKARKKLADQ